MHYLLCREWLLKNGYSGIKLFGKNGGEEIDWSLDDFMNLDKLEESVLLNITSPKDLCSKLDGISLLIILLLGK